MADGISSCFVMMPFSAPYRGYYDVTFNPAVESAGLRAVRADDITTPGIIVNQIWTAIRSAAVCLAELTTSNVNVMYELGLAHALGKPVIQVVQDMNSIPFDLRHLRHVVYDTSNPDWASWLQQEISENLLGALQDPVSARAFADAAHLQQSTAPKQAVRQVSVALSAGVIPDGSVVPTRVIISRAANDGPRPVSLTGVGLRLPDGQTLRNTAIGGSDGSEFPIYLRDGEGHSVIFGLSGLVRELRQSGYSGTLEVTGFIDASDNRYTSEPAYINLDEGTFYNMKLPESSP